MVLVGATLVNVLTCAAEIGGMAVVLQLIGASRYHLMLMTAAGLLLVAVFLLPQGPAPDSPGLAVYLHFAVGLLSSILMPYEIYFYSSGGIEDQWTPKDLPINKLTASWARWCSSRPASTRRCWARRCRAPRCPWAMRAS